MRRLLKPDTVLVDIGANVGYYTMLAAAQVGPTGKVIALEPGLTNGKLMRMSIAANGFDNVVLHPYAAAHQNGTGRFWLDEDSNGHLLPAEAPAVPETAETVPMVTLDSLLQDEPRIDIIKMDIEGSEGLALQGMRQLIQRHRPILFTEFSWEALPISSGISPEDYLDQLRVLGYTLLIIHRAGGLSPTPQSNAQIMQYRGKPGSLHHLDLLAYPCLPPQD
jgi:FkbM family methyltransferase